MAKTRGKRDLLLEEIGGEALDESGFEDEIPDPLYSDDVGPNPQRFDVQKERNNVH